MCHLYWNEIVHRPPSYTELPSFVKDLCRFFNDEKPKVFEQRELFSTGIC